MDASTTPLPDLVLYGRVGCHLCDEAHETLTSLLDERRRNGRPAPSLQVRDIDSDPAWRSAFSATIPVVELGDRRLELVTSVARLRRLLTDVLDS
jgi:glutaredoxin